jgi:hypothetical protein
VIPRSDRFVRREGDGRRGGETAQTKSKQREVKGVKERSSMPEANPTDCCRKEGSVV